MPLAKDKIHTGDCIAGLAKLEARSVDLVFADPPFNIGYKYDVYEDRKADEEYRAWSREWMAGVHRALKPDGTFWLAIGDDYAAELKVCATREVGFHCRSWVIWYYTFGVNCKRKFSRSHTHLFHFVKDPEKFTFNAEAIRVPSARQLVYADKRAEAKGPPARRHVDSPPAGFAGGFHAGRRHVVFRSRRGHVQGASGFSRLPDAGATPRAAS